MRKHLSTLSLLLVFFIGLSLLLYPTFSDYWNSLHQSRAIASYTEALARLDDESHQALLDQAREYNAALSARQDRWHLSDEEREVYRRMLSVEGGDAMGYIEIPSISVSLPIYHGISEGVLQVAVGHIEGSSLPVGGEGTHCVVSGHRGLPSAKLLTDLDRLAPGDIFLLRVLDEVLTYEVDQILIVEPTDVTALGLIPEGDYCTLVTCTPYGINSHRLLVRGTRIENLGSAPEIRVAAEAIQIAPLLVAPAVAAPMLLLLLIVLLVSTGGKKGRRGK